MRNSPSGVGSHANRTEARPLRHWADWIAPSLILLSLLVRYAKYHRYPLLTLEMLICAAALLAAGIGLSLVARLRRETLYPLIVGVLILQFADVHFQLFIRAVLLAAQISPIAVKPLLIVVFFAFMFAVFALRREIGRIVAVIWGVILLTTILLPSGQITAGETINRPNPNPRDLPLVLHIVLDEQIGVEGVPSDLPGGSELRRHLASEFLEEGFEIHGRAFSQYSESHYSLAGLLNGEVFSVSPDFVRPASAGYQIIRNDWLRSLAEKGYSIRIYQSGWIDFCQAEGLSPDYCYVYPTNSIRVLRQYSLDAWTKARLTLPRALTGSLPISAWPEPQLSTLSCLPALDKLALDIASQPRGTAFFVHLLLPHYSYAFDAECRLRPDPATWLNVGDMTVTGPGEFNSEARRAAAYPLYFQQVRCVTKRLKELLAQMRRDGTLQTATVIVHGDHGSRLATKAFSFVDPAVLSDRDMVDHFSTLMAIRRPDTSAAYLRPMRSIHEIFADRFLQRPVHGETTEVLMRPPPGLGGKGMLLSRPMVDFGTSDQPPGPPTENPGRASSQPRIGGSAHAQ